MKHVRGISHTIVAFGLTGLNIELCNELLHENPPPHMPEAFRVETLPSYILPSYEDACKIACDLACDLAHHHRAPLCIGVMRALFVLPPQYKARHAPVIELAMRVEYGEIIKKETLLNPQYTQKTLLAQNPSNISDTEAARTLVDLIHTRQMYLSG